MKLIQYYTQNPMLFYATLGTFLVAGFAIALIALMHKARKKKEELDKELNLAARALIEKQESEQMSKNQTKKPIEKADDQASPSNANTKDEQSEAVSNTAESNNDVDSAQPSNQADTNATTDNDSTVEAPASNDEEAVALAERVEEPQIQVPQKNNTIILPKTADEQAKIQQKSVYKPVNAQKSNGNDTLDDKQSERQVTSQEDTKQRILHKANETTQDVKTQAKPKSKYTGKWLIYTENGRFSANLVASNGEVLLRTESYTALSGIKSGIETVKNNIEKNNFALSVDKNGNYFFKLFSSSTRLLCISEAYSTKAVCESAINSVKRFAKTAVIEVIKEQE